MISKLSDRDLIKNVHFLVRQERENTQKVLEHLEEAFRRRLFADFGYPNLYKYMIRELKYSEGSAFRRISAMRLIKKVPEAKGLIAKGELNLSIAHQTQQFTKDKSPSVTKKVIDKVKGKTKDEATLELMKLGHRPFTAKADRRNPVSFYETRIHITIQNKTLLKLEKLKAIKKLNSQDTLDFSLGESIKNYQISLHKTNQSKGTTGRNIPSAIRKKILMRAKNRCEYKHCGEIRNLQFEHIIPYGKGGQHTIDNIKLFCRAHNQRSAIKEYGLNTMDEFIN